MNATTKALATEQVSTPVGILTVRATAEGVSRVGWRLDAGPVDGGSDPAADRIARAARDQLVEYFAGRRTDFDVPIQLDGLGVATMAVLTTLKDTVGFGATVTYGELAARSGSGVPARAIGSIMGSNPIPIMIGCHRVVASDGLGGYSGGEPGQGRQTKTWLLEHEGALPPALV